MVQHVAVFYSVLQCVAMQETATNLVGTRSGDILGRGNPRPHSPMREIRGVLCIDAEACKVRYVILARARIWISCVVGRMVCFCVFVFVWERKDVRMCACHDVHVLICEREKERERVRERESQKERERESERERARERERERERESEKDRARECV